MSANGSTSHKVAPTTHLDYESYYSDVMKVWPKPAIRGLFPYEFLPDMVSFLAGKPNPDAFPVCGMSVDVVNPSTGEAEKVVIPQDELKDSLQYGMSYGLPKFIKTLSALQQKLHNKPDVDAANPGVHTPWSTMTGNGSQDLISKAFMCLTNRGDTVLVEGPTFPGATSAAETLGNKIYSIPVDQSGLSATALRSTLENWDTAADTKHLKFPKVLYSIPTGGNPSGVSADAERKREVLQVIREFGLILFEDDPYYFLSFENLGDDPATRPRPQSYLALEQEGVETWGDGRVIRFDSLSKIMAAGFRIGMATGPATVLAAMDNITACYQLQPSFTAQCVVQAIFDKWGQDGFLVHCDKVARFYLERRNVFSAALEKTLGSNGGKQKPVAEWVEPNAGMFFFLKFRLPPTPAAPEGDSNVMIESLARGKGVLAVPGYAFLPNVDSSPYARVSFSVVPLDQIEKGLMRLRESVLETWAASGQNFE